MWFKREYKENKEENRKGKGRKLQTEREGSEEENINHRKKSIEVGEGSGKVMETKRRKGRKMSERRDTLPHTKQGHSSNILARVHHPQAPFTACSEGRGKTQSVAAKRKVRER